MYLYINQENAEAVFAFLAVLGAVGVVIAWFVTRRPSHRQRHS